MKTFLSTSAAIQAVLLEKEKHTDGSRRFNLSGNILLSTGGFLSKN